MMNFDKIVAPGGILERVGLGYIGIILGLFGIIGNLLTILILLSSSMRRTSTNIYLIALSCSNILFLLVVTISRSLRRILEAQPFLTSPSHPIYGYFLSRFPFRASYHGTLISIIYLTIAVAIDRLLSIKFPLKVKQIVRRRQILLIILFIYLFSIIYSIPFWLQTYYNSQLKERLFTNIGLKIRQYTRTFIFIPIGNIIPSIILTFLHIIIIKKLIEKKRRKQSLGVKRQTDDYIILMLVTEVFLFVLCQLPVSISLLWYAIEPSDKEDNSIFAFLTLLGELLFIFNASTNFLIHCFFGEKFRQIFIKFILNIFPNNNNNNKQRILETRISIKDKPENSQILEQKQIRTSPMFSTAHHSKKLYQHELFPLTTNINH